MNDDFQWRVPTHYSDPYFNLLVYKAAPYMYEALKSLIGWLEDDEKMVGNVVTIQNDCHKALAKAEGKEEK